MRKIDIFKALFTVILLALSNVGLSQDVVADSEANSKNETDNNAQIEEVEVIADKAAELRNMDAETERLFSVAGAANDPLQAIYALPGVTFSNGRGPAGAEPVIRGSAPQDNAYYIDQIPANYIFHAFGNSIFNKYLINSFDLYPAAFPSEYSNATGGIIDVTLREPRQQDFTTTLNTSFIEAGILVESGIGEDQAFYAAFRRSMLDFFVENDDISDEEEGFKVDKFPVSEDYQVKYRWQVNEKNSFTFLAAGASDVLAATFFEGNEQVAQDPDFAGPAEIKRGFDSVGLVWNVAADDYQLKLFLNHLSDNEDLSFGRQQFENTGSERNTLRVLFDKPLSDEHFIKSGLSATTNRYDIDFNAKLLICNDFDPQCSSVDAEFIAYQDILKVNSYELFFEDQWLINEQHVLSLGLHYGNDDYLKEGRLEPRIKWEYFISDSFITYVSAGQYSQLPELREIIDLLGNPNLTTVKADHIVWGVSQDFNESWRWSVDAYYKNLKDIVLSAEQDDSTENYNNSAEGEAYGVELLLNKNITDRWYGWVSLSLAQTERTNTVTGDTVKFEYDKPVLFNLVVNRLVGEKWMLGIKWNYQSGARYTAVNELVPSQSNPDVLVPIYGELNAYRLPDYHRLDFRAEYTQPKSWGYWKFYIDILNLYNRENIEGYSISLVGDELISPPPGFGTDVPVTQEEGDGLFPSIGFEVQF